MSTLHVRLFGQFQMNYANQPNLTITKRGQMLLAYLLLAPAQWHTRQEIAFRLWPDTTERQAHSNLRTELTRLRQAFPGMGDFLQDQHNCLQWRTDAPFTLDVADFEQAIQQALLVDYRSNGHDALLALQQAIAVYTGDLLPNLYEDWVLCERQRLSDAFITALERLIARLKVQGDYARAIQYAQQLLRYDALHEITYRHLMELHALHGNQASAQRVYQACVTILQRELAVEPSAITQQLYRDIMDGVGIPSHLVVTRDRVI